jgi:hypothetical protein
MQGFEYRLSIQEIPDFCPVEVYAIVGDCGHQDTRRGNE